MQQDIPVCPGCGAGLQSAAPSAATPACQYCGWQAPESRVPSGPNHFRQLLAEQLNNSDDLLDQVPEDLREILAGRLRAPTPEAQRELSENTPQALRGMGYAVSEAPLGTRISSAPRMGGTPAALSPSDVVRLAAESEGGVKPRSQLPVCPKCRGLSPIGQAKCQWCGEPLPPTPVP
jgi:hypothetical protein